MVFRSLSTYWSILSTKTKRIRNEKEKQENELNKIEQEFKQITTKENIKLLNNILQSIGKQIKLYWKSKFCFNLINCWW